MASTRGKAKEAVGWLTADRDVEAEGRREQELDREPTDAETETAKDDVREQYGETPDGSARPDARH